MAQSNFRIRWLANQVDPRYIPNPTNVDPIFEFVIINDDTQENLMEYFEIDLALNHRGNARNGVFVPNAVGRVTIVDDDGRKLLLMHEEIILNCCIMHCLLQFS